MSAYGYERGFTIDHDPTVRRTITCRDCIFYEDSDRSCNKTSRYLPVDGYSSWRYCGHFELDQDVSYSKEKGLQFLEWVRRHPDIYQKESKEKLKKSKRPKRKKSLIKENYLSYKDCAWYILTQCENYRQIPAPRKYKYVKIKLSTGKKSTVKLCIFEDKAYVNSSYSQECIDELKRWFKKS